MLYGHTPVPQTEWLNNTMCPDTGCAFGGRLTAFLYPERAVVSVPAARVYHAPARPFPVGSPSWSPDPASARREPAGVRVAPFQLLASQGAVYRERPHAWHLDVADRLAAAAPDLIATTRRIAVEVADPASVGAATRWWEDLTAAGGEGMVVKPAANLDRAARGEPLWRVHECVFAVLALESEPVDPRL